MLFEESFGIIALKKEKGRWQVFLVKLKSGNHWGFPKGHPNPNESPKKTAIRELKEETSLNVVEFLEMEPLKEHYECIKQGKKVSKKVCYFPAIVSGDEKIQKGEIIDGKWVDFFDSAYDTITYLQSKEVCKKMQKYLLEQS